MSMSFISYYSWVSTWTWFSMSLIMNFPSRHVRLFFLRRKGAHIANNVSIWRGVEIRNPKGLTIKSGCSIGPGVTLDARSGLIIGENVTIAKDAIIWTLHHDMNSKNFQTIGGKTIINDYVWICSRSILLPGLVVGRGAVIASNAVVTKNVEPLSVMGGVPAKKIGDRKEQNFTYVPFVDMHIL